MKWFKNHWNDPITVGGYTKMCLWSFVISMAMVALELIWFFTDIRYRIDVWFMNLRNKFN